MACPHRLARDSPYRRWRCVPRPHPASRRRCWQEAPPPGCPRACACCTARCPRTCEDTSVATPCPPPLWHRWPTSAPRRWVGGAAGIGRGRPCSVISVWHWSRWENSLKGAIQTDDLVNRATQSIMKSPVKVINLKCGKSGPGREEKPGLITRYW